DVPAPDGGETDAGGVALAGDAVALEHPDLVEPATERLGDDLPHAQGGAGGRVDLVPMVRLDDLDVVAGREDAGGQLEQLEGGVDADAHVRGEDDRHRIGRGLDRGAPRVVEAGRADDRAHPVAHAGLQ